MLTAVTFWGFLGLGRCKVALEVVSRLDELCKDIDFLGDSSVKARESFLRSVPCPACKRSSKAQLENLRVAHSATLALLGARSSARF